MSSVSQFCGYYCICYCLYRSSGIDMQKIVCSFTSDTSLNDVLVHALVCRIRKIKTRFKCTNVSFISHARMHARTHTHTERVNIDVHILMSLEFEIDDNFSIVKIRMTTNDAQCSVVVEHVAPGQTLATGVEVGVPLSLEYDERGRVL